MFLLSTDTDGRGKILGFTLFDHSGHPELFKTMDQVNKRCEHLPFDQLAWWSFSDAEEYHQLAADAWQSGQFETMAKDIRCWSHVRGCPEIREIKNPKYARR